ncbi:hypothetical protein ACUN13_29470 [Bacillus cereus group sp. Bce041]|uniref:hypothetical protein n=1 Tax=Bacillus cereus group sp. Bce041 TaxID=3445228 RepID=UPI004041DB9E
MTRDKVEEVGQRSKLEVINNTNFEPNPESGKGEGSELHLKWGGDTRPENQETDLPVGQSDTKESKYVHNGGNIRTFIVGVSKGDIPIGGFIHSVKNPPGGAGSENTTLHVQYVGDEVVVYRNYFNTTTDEVMREDIGTISLEDWKS